MTRIVSGGMVQWLGLVVVVLTLLIGSALFLPQQSLWLDEATQMSGLSLDPVAVVRWLLGIDRPDFGQLRDRTPPLSYWLGWSWSRAFGSGETSLRWFGVSCVAVAAGLIYEAARQAFGTVGGWLAGLLFVLSPSVVLLAVEIRAYPVFLLWSAAAWYLMVRWTMTEDEPRWPTRVALALVLAAGVFTHFFGVVLAGAVLVSLAVLDRREGKRLGPILGVGGIVAGAVVAIVPFVRSSMTLYIHGPDRFADTSARLKDLKNLLAGQVGHMTLTVFRPVETVALVMAIVLLLLAIRSLWISRRGPGVAVAMALAAGFAAVAVVKLSFSKFDAASPNYNAWMRPGVCLLLSAGISSRERRGRLAALAAAVVLVSTQAHGVYQLAVHGDHFSHGPHQVISRIIRQLGPRDLAVVHDDPSKNPFFIYCPIRFDWGPGLDQYLLTPSPGGPARVRTFPNGPETLPVTALTHRYLLVIRPIATRPRDLVTQIRQGDKPMEPGPIARQLRESDRRRLVSETHSVALISAEIDVFERLQTPDERKAMGRPRGPVIGRRTVSR